MPFELQKPSADTPVTRASEVMHGTQWLGEILDTLALQIMNEQSRGKCYNLTLGEQDGSVMSASGVTSFSGGALFTAKITTQGLSFTQLNIGGTGALPVYHKGSIIHPDDIICGTTLILQFIGSMSGGVYSGIYNVVARNADNDTFYRKRKLDVEYVAKVNGSSFDIMMAEANPSGYNLKVGVLTFPLVGSGDSCPHIIRPSGMKFVRYCAIQGATIVGHEVLDVSEISDVASWQTVVEGGTDHYTNKILVVSENQNTDPWVIEDTNITIHEAISECKDWQDNLEAENFKQLISSYATSAQLAPFSVGNLQGTRPSGYDAYFEIPVTAQTGAQTFDFRPLVSLYETAHVRLNIQGNSYYETVIYLPAGYGFDVTSAISLHNLNEQPQVEDTERMVTLQSNVIGFASWEVESIPLDPNTVVMASLGSLPNNDSNSPGTDPSTVQSYTLAEVEANNMDEMDTD